MAPRDTYRQIADQLRELISRGELRPGSMLPSELALAQEHGVARGTVRSAFASLVDEGLVEVVPGKGRRVWERLPPFRQLPTSGSRPSLRLASRRASSP